MDFLLKLLLKPAIYKPLTKIVAKSYDKAEQEVKKVVEKVKQNGRRAPGRFGPQRFVLVHCRHHHRFPYRTAAQGRVSHIGNDNAAFFIDAFEKRGSRRYVGRTAYDCVVRH